MKRMFILAAIAALVLVASNAIADEKKEMKAEKKPVTLKGEIVDTGCYIAHGAMGEKHKDCASKCIANGMPMGNASAVYVNQKFLDGSNVSGADTSVEQAEVVCAGLGAPYRARHDIHFSGTIDGGDTSSMQVQVIRAALGTGTSLGCSNICPN